MTARALATFLNLRAAIGSQSQSREGRLHWIGSPQMVPLLFGIVVKRHHPIPVLVDQISRCLQSSLATPMLESSFDLLGFLPCFCIRDLPQHQQRRFVPTLGDLSQQVDDAMIPASLLVGFWENVAQRPHVPRSPDARQPSPVSVGSSPAL